MRVLAASTGLALIYGVVQVSVISKYHYCVCVPFLMVLHQCLGIFGLRL